MAQPLTYLQNLPKHDWLICDNSSQFQALTEKLYLELTEISKKRRTPQKIILAEREPVKFLASFLAACAANCAVFLCNPDWGTQEWQQVFQLVQPDIIWGIENSEFNVKSAVKNRIYTDKTCLRRFPNLNFFIVRAGGLCLCSRASALGRQRCGRLCRLEATVVGFADLKHLACEFHSPRLKLRPIVVSHTYSQIMIPTGGSSGKIKFAIHTWKTLTASVQGFTEYFQLKQVNSFCVLPLYHVSGLMQFMRSFTTGGKLAILSFKTLESGQILSIQPSEFFISLVPTQLQRLLQNSELTQWLAQFKTVMLGGAPAWNELLEKARFHNIRLAPTYGMTETASQIATLKPDDFLQGKINSGQILPHAKVTIRNQHSEVLNANEIGNIIIQAKSLTLGYYPLIWENQDYLQVDDLGFLDSQDYLHIIGRSSDKIITGGENVYPVEIESAIRETQMVADVCVIGVPDKHWGQALTAIYVPQEANTSYLEIQTLLKNKLSKFKVPKHWISLENLPRNSQGKINRQALQQIATEFLSGTE